MLVFLKPERLRAPACPRAHSQAGFTGAGCDYIGMDHFALPDDGLAVARRPGRQHRNFTRAGRIGESSLPMRLAGALLAGSSIFTLAHGLGSAIAQALCLPGA